MPEPGLDSALPTAALWESAARRGVDLTVAAVALGVLALPMIVIGLIIRWSGIGPALFQQQRVGLGGRPFTMYKFRTMRAGVPRTAGPRRFHHGADSLCAGANRIPARCLSCAGWCWLLLQSRRGH